MHTLKALAQHIDLLAKKQLAPKVNNELYGVKHESYVQDPPLYLQVDV